MKTPAILVADDDPEVLNYLETALLCHKFPVLAARDGGEALALLEEHKGLVSTVVLDSMMPRQDGIETLHTIRRRYPDLPVVMISGASDPERIVEAMRAGAQEYLTKPVDHEKLLAAVRRTTALQRPGAETKSTAAEPADPPERYVQVNPRMRAISEALRKTAAWNVPVVLRGESGVGKEVLARELHLLSPRASREFVKINCVALPSELLESELFGYERGAFTGAFRAKPGKFELADGGTILLDEIGDMDLKLQAKLLQVLQDGEIHRLGGKEPVRVDVRVLVATHRDLERSIAEGNFREDLYYRLNVVSIEVPPLRERKDEILPLAEHFLEKHCQPENDSPALTDELRMAFLTYDWPGNVRELENVVRRYLVFEDAPSVVRQLLAAASARAGARAGNGFFAGDSAAIAERADGRYGVAGGGDRLPEMSGRYLRSTAAMPANVAEPLGQASAAPARAMANGTYAAAAGAAGYSVHPLQPPDAEGAGNGVRRPPFEPAAFAQGPVPARLFPDSELTTTAPPFPASQNSDGWMSRLARLESLLGCLVLGAPETPPAIAEAAPEAASPAANENDQQFASLGELDEERNRVEMQAILAALEKTEWNRKKAARLLKTDYKALLYRMKKLGVGERNDAV
jgi:two-component system response regulator AtoC